MKLTRFTRTGRRRADVDDVLAAYSAWRSECAAVRAAYGRWARGATRDADVTVAAYLAALDREERAAERYARLLVCARGRPEIDLVRQLGHLPALFGAM